MRSVANLNQFQVSGDVELTISISCSSRHLGCHDTLVSMVMKCICWSLSIVLCSEHGSTHQSRIFSSGKKKCLYHAMSWYPTAHAHYNVSLQLFPKLRARRLPRACAERFILASSDKPLSTWSPALFLVEFPNLRRVWLSSNDFICNTRERCEVRIWVRVLVHGVV